MENNLGLTVAVPEDNSQRVSHVQLDFGRCGCFVAPEVVPLRQEAAKTRGLGCFVLFFKEQGEHCLGKELEEKMEGGLSLGALARAVCKVRLGSPGVLLNI